MKALFMSLLSVGFAIALSACNIKAGNSSEDENTSQSYTYSFSYNGCETGSKTFSNMTDYCNSLKDDSANRYCARSMRYDRFRQECPGSWN